MNGSDGSTADARDAMQQAQRLDETIRTRTRWYGHFLLTGGGVLFVGVSLLGIAPTIAESFGSTIGVIFLVAIPGLLLAAMVLGMVYTNRQPVTPHSYSHWPNILGSAAILLAVTSQGWRLPFLSPLWTMLLAGAVSALPFFVGAYLEFRLGDPAKLRGAHERQ